MYIVCGTISTNAAKLLLMVEATDVHTHHHPRLTLLANWIGKNGPIFHFPLLETARSSQYWTNSSHLLNIFTNPLFSDDTVYRNTTRIYHELENAHKNVAQRDSTKNCEVTHNRLRTHGDRKRRERVCKETDRAGI